MSGKDEGVAEAMRCWEMRLNCAESVLRGVCKAKGIAVPEIGLKMATPFGGGIGRSEDVCGALSGGVLAIGAALGRTRPEEDRLRSYEAAGRMYRRFCEEFGSRECRALNKGDFSSPEHRPRCGRYVRGATEIAIDVLSE